MDRDTKLIAIVKRGYHIILTAYFLPTSRQYIQDITWSRVDMNFIFECSTRYLTSERSERVRYRVEHEKIKLISTSGHVIFCLLYKHRINSCEKGAIYYVTITTVISSRVKITCYLHVWRYEVFTGKLTWYFTGVYIIKCGIAVSKSQLVYRNAP